MPPLSNGIRLIPFRDLKTYIKCIYLGDFIFECNDTTKNISYCEKGVLIPVNYPKIVVKNRFTYKIWSEMVKLLQIIFMLLELH